MNRREKPSALSDRGPLNVLFLITRMPVGGQEVLLSQLAKGMDATRFRTSIACLKDRGELGDKLTADLDVHANLIRGKYDVSVVGKLVRLFQRQSIDAVVTVGAGDKMFWGRLAAKRARVPVILSAIHSTGWPDEIGRLNRLLTPITDAFIAVAQSHGNYLVEQEKFPRDKVAVIANGIDVNRFQPDATARAMIREELSIASDAPCCGIVAALRPEKNHLLFLRMAQQVLHKVPEAHFVIVGDGPERKKIEIAASSADLKGRVHMLGTRSDTPQVLSALDCFALTSHIEASPVSILEAMSTCLPIVSTRVGSIHESVIEGETGYLAESGDAELLGQRVSEIFSDPELRSRLGEAGRNRVVERASLESMVRGYEDLVVAIYNAKLERQPKESWIPGELRSLSSVGNQIGI